MDRKQRVALCNLLAAQAWYIITTNDNYSETDFERAKLDYEVAEREFNDCEAEPVAKGVAQPVKSPLL